MPANLQLPARFPFTLVLGKALASSYSSRLVLRLLRGESTRCVTHRLPLNRGLPQVVTNRKSSATTIISDDYVWYKRQLQIGQGKGLLPFPSFLSPFDSFFPPPLPLLRPIANLSPSTLSELPSCQGNRVIMQFVNFEVNVTYCHPRQFGKYRINSPTK